MDFDDTPEEAAFRAEARAFLEANAARKTASSGAERYWRHRRGRDQAGAAGRWQAMKADAGFSGITWPKAMGRARRQRRCSR